MTGRTVNSAPAHRIARTMARKPLPRTPDSPSRDTGSAPATLGMVAEVAGVSASTVSRILNGTAAVSDEKKQAVYDAIARLGFVPNPVARGLAGGRTLSIGVVTQALDSPFYGSALSGIEDTLDRQGYSALFVSGQWNAAEEARCIEVLRARRVDGIIVLTGRLTDAALREVARALPVVVTGRRLRAPNLVALDFDNAEGARLATRHLLDLGHRRIAFITGDVNHPDAVQRLQGYHHALQEAGLRPDEVLVEPGLFHEESGVAAMERLLARGTSFSAVFAANDQMAIGACLALHRHGLRVPEDCSVIGFDDLAMSRYCIPPLSTVQHPSYEIGRLAAQAMLGLLAGESPDLPVPMPKVVVRESTATPAAR
jgi:LacI family transcriptional regulator